MLLCHALMPFFLYICCMKRLLLLLCVSGLCTFLSAQNRVPDVVRVTRQHWFPSVPAGNYSGVTHIGGDRYAIVDDKHPCDGFLVVTVKTDSLGAVVSVEPEGFMTDSTSNRDAEDIVFVSGRGTVFTSGEKNNDIVELNLDGRKSGFELNVPPFLKTSRGNNGLEALAYNSATRTLWTCTETPLPKDGAVATTSNAVSEQIRLVSFDENFAPLSQCLYLTDKPSTRRQSANYVLGVSALCALDDGSLLVLERECFVSRNKLGSFVVCKLYHVVPDDGKKYPVENIPVGQMQPLRKTLLHEWKTRMNLFHQDFANYEGMCLMPSLSDGSKVLLLVADSQAQYGGLLRDWFMTIVLK